MNASIMGQKSKASECQRLLSLSAGEHSTIIDGSMDFPSWPCYYLCCVTDASQ